MLIKAKKLKGYKLDSLDGEIGKVKEFYFDDKHWTIRYLVADTGNWLTGRQVLISPYAPKLYYERVLTFLREYTPPNIQVPLERQFILAFLRSIYQLGIRGIERTHYWWLFFWTLFRRPRLFPLAITFAIYGFHFRQVIELHVS